METNIYITYSVLESLNAAKVLKSTVVGKPFHYLFILIYLLAGDRRQELGEEAGTEGDNETGRPYIHGRLHRRDGHQTVRLRIQEVLHGRMVLAGLRHRRGMQTRTIRVLFFCFSVLLSRPRHVASHILGAFFLGGGNFWVQRTQF